MTDWPVSRESSESEICVNCGFCCDGTLFGYAVSGVGEAPESFVSIGLTPTGDSAGQRSGFRLPCPHFTGVCSVYDSPRPWICGAFRCRLLKSVEKGTFTASQAQEKVREAKALREKLLPVFDAMYADALAADARPHKHEGSLIVRLRLVVSMMARPGNAQFREKYGKLMMTAFELASRLSNDFLPKPRREKKDDPAQT